ncbi:MAG: FAD-binding oxidoreductase, partial [Thermomicrobiales bacterium]
FALDTQFSATVPFTKIDVSKLQESVRGSVLLPGHADFAAAWQPWSIGPEHKPALIVIAETAQDIVAAVSFARDFDLPVSVQATGHGVQVPNIDGVHINTARMTGVTINPEARTARVEAGAKWAHVIPEAHTYGLAPLNGSTTDVGVVGYSLGGGTGWMARKYGFAADHIMSMDVVTANGELIKVNAESNPDLFWAMRGGSSNFGVVTAMEFNLFPVPTFYGGGVYYPLSAGNDVFAAYGEWIQTLPNDVTASISIFRFPPLPFIPEPLQGQQVIRVAAVAIGENGEELIAPMRTIATPLLDSMGEYPYPMIDLVSADPVDPMPVRETSMMFDEFPQEAVDALMSVAGPGIETPLLMIEIRYIRGAGDRAGKRANAANRVGGSFMLFALGVPFNPEVGEAIASSITHLHAVLRPYATGKTFLNFIGHSEPGADRTMDAFTLETYVHLARTKTKYDPTNRFRFNRNILPELGTSKYS